MIQSVVESGIIHIFKGKQTIPIKLIIGEILTAEIMDIFPTGNIQIKINDRILNAQPQRELSFRKGETIYVKVEKPFSDGTIPLRVLSTSEVQQIQKASAESEILKEIPAKIFKFIDSIFTSKQQSFENKNFLSTILTLPVEKVPDTEKTALLEKLIKIFSDRSSTAEMIKNLIDLLENKELFEEAQQLKNIVLFNEITSETLKKIILNSGVAFEPKLKKVVSEAVNFENIGEDLKIVLNNIIREAGYQGNEKLTDRVQQILRQIEGYQVLSKTYQSFFTFLPVLWKDIEGGSFAFKSFKRQGKDYHTVFVSLKIKDEESLFFVVTMINKSFFISFSGNSETTRLIRSYEDQLKERFHQAGMIIGGINYFTKVQELIKQWSIREGLINVTA